MCVLNLETFGHIPISENTPSCRREVSSPKRSRSESYFRLARDGEGSRVRKYLLVSNRRLRGQSGLMRNNNETHLPVEEKSVGARNTEGKQHPPPPPPTPSHSPYQRGNARSTKKNTPRSLVSLTHVRTRKYYIPCIYRPRLRTFLVGFSLVSSEGGSLSISVVFSSDRHPATPPSSKSLANHR